MKILPYENDFFFSDDLQNKLDKHVKTLPVPVRINRLKNREGLIRARLAGAQMASGDVLIFLDAHTEVCSTEYNLKFN